MYVVTTRPPAIPALQRMHEMISRTFKLSLCSTACWRPADPRAGSCTGGLGPSAGVLQSDVDHLGYSIVSPDPVHLNMIPSFSDLCEQPPPGC